MQDRSGPCSQIKFSAPLRSSQNKRPLDVLRHLPHYIEEGTSPNEDGFLSQNWYTIYESATGRKLDMNNQEAAKWTTVIDSEITK